MSSKRRLRRFYSHALLPAAGGTVTLSLDESRHMTKTIRLDSGDVCLLIDDRGFQAEGRVLGTSAEGAVSLEIVAEPISGNQASDEVQLRVFIAMPRHTKFEFIVQKAQELGVYEISPLVTERTVVRVEPKKLSAKMDRWNKIAREAAKQSGCLELVRITEPLELQLIENKRLREGFTGIVHPSEAGISFSSWIQSINSSMKPEKDRTINLLFGPEGGFSDREVKLLTERAGAKAKLVTLGPRILKLDTAFVGAVSAVRFMTSE